MLSAYAAGPRVRGVKNDEPSLRERIEEGDCGYLLANVPALCLLPLRAIPFSVGRSALKGIVMNDSVCAQSNNVSSTLLDSYLGQDIAQICAHGYNDATLNHCAHFVCHVMNVSAGSVSCRAMSSTKAADKIGACIRVHELFAACPELGLYDDAAETQLSTGVFVFVTAKTAVKLKTKTMTNIPKKHVGIGLNGTIWHYSNTKDEVVTATPDEFRKHYKSQVNGLYFGTFPATAAPSSFGCGR
jgi:hypothetical protein